MGKEWRRKRRIGPFCKNFSMALKAVEDDDIEIFFLDSYKDPFLVKRGHGAVFPIITEITERIFAALSLVSTR
jgi:hypothetical protein